MPLLSTVFVKEFVNLARRWSSDGDRGGGVLLEDFCWSVTDVDNCLDGS